MKTTMDRDVFTGKWPEQDLAEIAYRVYTESGDEDAPDWEAISEEKQQAWCRAMIEVKKSITWYSGGFGPAMGDA